jgi:cytidyltransferase-like protein
MALPYHLKWLLSRVYVLCAERGHASLSLLQKEYPVERTYLIRLLHKLKNLGLIAFDKGIKLTPEGRKELKVVLAGGVFDIIHPGHIYTLAKAKELGDVLIVVIATDKRVRSLKNRSALHSANLRKKLVNALKFVDIAVIGSQRDIFDTVIRFKPDIIALGYDQAHDEESLRVRCREAGLNTQIFRISTHLKGIKTSKILHKLYEF